MIRETAPVEHRRTPTFSVVMPAYNAASTVEAAIDSVLAQTRDDFELIVVDDGSTDDTAVRVQRYLGDPRISLIPQTNLGQAVARNAAIAASRGEFVSLLDSDDLWLPHYLDVMAATFEREPMAGVAYTDAWVLDDRTRRIARSTAMGHWHPAVVPKEPEPFLRALLELGNFVFVGATIRREVLAEVGPFRTGVLGCEDYELWLRIASRGYRFARCPVNLAVYRRSAGQTSSDPDQMRRSGHEVFRIVAEEYDIPDDVRELARRRLPIERFGMQRRRRFARIPAPIHQALVRVRDYHVRTPTEVREAFPDLRSR
jgi:glycosyltransferase involved in cell wall biosynthesis